MFVTAQPPPTRFMEACALNGVEVVVAEESRSFASENEHD
jgi:hypothetical protein